jgi:hypothetical protein
MAGITFGHAVFIRQGQVTNRHFFCDYFRTASLYAPGVAPVDCLKARMK